MPVLRADPIIAIATAPGRGAVGIVRVSGNGLAPFARALCGRELQPRHATWLTLRDAAGQPIDNGLAIWFPAPHSYTGEDVLELQIHGGPVVLQLLLARCLEAAASPTAQDQRPCLPHLRLARPGEFTERAFMEGKLDLAQAEAVADLIDASTEAAARSASRSVSGAFSARIHALRDAIIQMRVLVEATLDFPEEEEPAALHLGRLPAELQTVQHSLDEALRLTRQGVLLREGIKVVIAGQPNAGKSSLLNALAGAELAIVTPVAGTTRDKVQQTIQIEGVPVHVVDTAGLRHSEDDVEKIGIARAWDEIASADAVIFLHDLTRAHDAAYAAADETIAAELARQLRGVQIIHVGNKTDAIPASTAVAQFADAILLSAKTGSGLEALRQRLLQLAGWQTTDAGLFMARERHIQALLRTQQHIEAAAAHAESDRHFTQLDILAEELRLAQNALGEITGEFLADDLLGVIFSSFCIGK